MNLSLGVMWRCCINKICGMPDEPSSLRAERGNPG